MGREEVYNSVSMGIMMMGLYVNQVIEDQGLEKALDHWNKVGYIFGSGSVASLKEKFGDETPTPEGLKEILTGNLTGFGSDFEITTDSKSVDVTIKKCAIHNGLSMAGFDNDLIAKFCKAGGGGELSAVTKAFPMLEPIHKPRTHADGVCIEGYKIKQ